MNRRGTAFSALVVGTGVLGVFTLGAVSALETAAVSATSVTDIILIGFQVIILPLVVAVWKRLDKIEREHRREMDDLLDAQARKNEEAAEKWGRYSERSDATQKELAALGERLSEIGSNIANRVERALQDRAAVVDTQIDNLTQRLDRMEPAR